MTTNPEQDVLDAIDALVDEQMAGGEYAAEHRASVAAADIDRCALCKGSWHGDPWTGIDREHLGEYDQHNHGRRLACPGAFATGPQRIRYRWQRQGWRWGTLSGRPWLVSIGQNHPPANRMFDNLGNPMRRLNNPIEQAHRSITNVYNALDVLGVWDGVNVEPWQREVVNQWYGGNSDLPEQMRYPRPYQRPIGIAERAVYLRALEEHALRSAAELGIPPELVNGHPHTDFQYVGNMADGVNTVEIAVDDADIQSVRYSTSPNYGGGEIRGPRGGDSVLAWLDEAGPMRGIETPSMSAMEGITVPKMFMQSARGGREAMKRFGGLTLMSYWGAPSAAGTWWELDLWNGRVWTGVDITTEVENVHDVRNRGRRGQTFPPTRSTFIELTALGGLHINPIGVIAVGASNRDGSHHILRAYVKSHTNDPPVLYNDDRHPALHQPTLWARRDLPVGRHPQQLVAMIREAEHL